MVCLLREKNQLEQVQICSQLEIILTFSRKCLFYRIFTLPNFTLREIKHLKIQNGTYKVELKTSGLISSNRINGKGLFR